MELTAYQTQSEIYTFILLFSIKESNGFVITFANLIGFVKNCLPKHLLLRVSGFCVTCFLSFIVLMQMTMSFLPELSNPMSLLAVYVFLMMCCSVFINVACILMLRIYHKPEDEKVISCLIITCNSLIQFASPNNSLITFSYIMSFKSFIFTQFDFNSVHTQLMPLFIMCIFACLNKVNYPIYREMSDELQVPQWMQKVVRVVGCQICRCCDKDPNSDLPEITWPDVGRTLDFFFFIAFIAGQSALTFFFLVPLATRY